MSHGWLGSFSSLNDLFLYVTADLMEFSNSV